MGIQLIQKTTGKNSKYDQNHWGTWWMKEKDRAFHAALNVRRLMGAPWSTYTRERERNGEGLHLTGHKARSTLMARSRTNQQLHAQRQTSRQKVSIRA